VLKEKNLLFHRTEVTHREREVPKFFLSIKSIGG